jgi:D-aspartate ligase
MPLNGSAFASIDSSTPLFALRRSFAELQHGVLNVARSAGRLGIAVHATRSGRHESATRSRYVRGTVGLPSSASDGQWLSELLAYGAKLGRPVLVGLDDDSAVFVDDHREALDEAFLIPASPPGLARRLASKRVLCELCEQVGVPAPEASFPASEDEAAEQAAARGYPAVLKRSEPWLEPRDPGAPSVAIARTEAELRFWHRRMESELAPQVMIQEYIPGDSSSIWMFNGYFGARSECLCAFTGRKLRQRGPRTGPTTLGVCSWNAAVAESASELMRGLSYRGIVDMGFRYDERDGRYKLLDVNPRAGSTFRLFTAANGLDVVRAAYLDLTGQPVPSDHARDGRRWLVEPYDLVAAAQLASAGELTLSGWARSLRVEEAAWWARDDPLPFLGMCASLAWQSVKYPLRRRRRARAERLQGRVGSASGGPRASLE